MPQRFLYPALQSGAFLNLKDTGKVSKHKLLDLQKELAQPILLVDGAQKLDIHLSVEQIHHEQLFKPHREVRSLTAGLFYFNPELALCSLPADPTAISVGEMRNFWLNLKNLRELFPYIIFINQPDSPWEAVVAPYCVGVLHPGPSDFLQGLIHLHQDATALAAAIVEVHKLHIIKLNPPSRWLRWLVHYWWICAVFLLGLTLLVPVLSDQPIFMYKDLQNDLHTFSQDAFVSHTFDGKTTMQRVAKHAIGRYTAQVPTTAEVEEYIAETWDFNSHLDSQVVRRLQRRNPIYPDSGLNMRFYPPKLLYGSEDLIAAWNYYTALLSDSINYITEYYNLNPQLGRIHRGIDVAGRNGTRILAPFNGKVWTFEDERGGVVIAISQDSLIALYMHCDQLFYMDGQVAYQGDPVGTVGMTGHTTGPHVHIATGIVNKKGPYSAGPLRYRMIDPVIWHRDYLSK